MTFLPIVARELREGARRKSTRWVRFIVAAVALVICLLQLTFISFFMRATGSSGSTGFVIMTGYAFVLCLLAGVFITADCLSEEKRAGTLGLLFLTDLRGHDVVLGKLAAQLVHLGYGLLAIIPAAALPLLLGGVTGGELWRISLALLNLLFFSLACGILASALSRQAGRAMFLAGLLLAMICILLPSVNELIHLIWPKPDTAWLAWFSPAQAYQSAFQSASRIGTSNNFWTALGISHLLAWAMIAIASWHLPKSWQDKPVATQRPGWLERVGVKTSSAKIRRRRELLDTVPLHWLIGEPWSARVISWGVAISWALGMLTIGYFRSPEALLVALIYGRVLLFPVKLLFAFQATRFIAESRRTGAFELLLAAPISSADLIAAQWAVLRRVFLPPCLLVLGSTVLMALYVLVTSNVGLTSTLAGAGVGSIFGLFFLLEGVLDFFALGWLGMWLALTMRKPHLAASATILFVLILPSFICMVGIVVDIILIVVFGAKLRTDFRQLALNPPADETKSASEQAET